MNWNMIEGNWRLYRNELMNNWGHLTDEDLALIAGKRPRLALFLQDIYGISRDEAEQQIRGFQDQVTTMPRYHSNRDHNKRGHPKWA
jgi:uncharacterized protein YjbJ (UPF0337 family)